MKNILSHALPKKDSHRKWAAILSTAAIAWILTLLGIYGIGEYGLGMFVLTPLFIGACPVILYGTSKETSKKNALLLGAMALAVFTAGLLIFAMEGLICIVMAAPIAIFLTWLGTLVGYLAVKRKPGNAANAMLVLMAAIPLMSFIEKDKAPALTAVTTSIEINADLESVWNNVVEFPELDQPTEFIFKTGIAYPINAKIEGKGVGAIRYCNFTTGSFVEPITIWDHKRLLAFDVRQQPAPLTELSFWDLDAPHLHDYFVSKKGQFKLKKLPNGHTLLEGTTWYSHRIRPAFYWQIWSRHIVHQIHHRVLEHIKRNTEQGFTKS